MRLLHAPQACSLQRHVKIRVLRRVHAMQREVRREQMPRSMPRHRGVLLLRHLSCFDQVPAPGRVQHPDHPVRQLHHRTHGPYLSFPFTKKNSPPPFLHSSATDHANLGTGFGYCVQSFMFLLRQLACICSLVACIVGNQQLSEASRAISCLSDMVYWTVCSCMQTQHKVEMDKRDGTLNVTAMAFPPVQQMSRMYQ